MGWPGCHLTFKMLVTLLEPNWSLMCSNKKASYFNVHECYRELHQKFQKNEMAVPQIVWTLKLCKLSLVIEKIRNTYGPDRLLVMSYARNFLWLCNIPRTQAEEYRYRQTWPNVDCCWACTRSLDASFQASFIQKHLNFVHFATTKHWPSKQQSIRKQSTWTG